MTFFCILIVQNVFPSSNKWFYLLKKELAGYQWQKTSSRTDMCG
jgi:hypothetical protein